MTLEHLKSTHPHKQMRVPILPPKRRDKKDVSNSAKGLLMLAPFAYAHTYMN